MRHLTGISLGLACGRCRFPHQCPGVTAPHISSRSGSHGVTETGLAASVTESAGHIWAALARRYGPGLVLLEHYLAPELGEGMETLDLVRIGTDGSPHWSRVWPTPEDNPRHAGLELWMAAYGHQIAGSQ